MVTSFHLRATFHDTLMGQNVSAPIRVLIADAHPVVRDGLKRLLEDEPDLTVVGLAGDGLEALRLVHKLRPDVTLLDLAMPRCTGLEALRELVGPTSHTRPLLLTASISEHEFLEALRLGAHGVILKEAPTETVMKAIRVVRAGQYWFNRSTLADLVQFLRTRFPEGGAPGVKPAPRLTSRELQVVELIGAGAPNREIASRLGVSIDTVKHHLTHVYDKLGLSNRLELAVYAMNRGLVAGKAAG